MTDTQTTLFSLKHVMDTFITERDWYQFHNPKIDSMGSVVETSELLALFLFSKPGAGGQDVLLAKRESVEDELSDVLMWVLTFSTSAKIDLTRAVCFRLTTATEVGDQEMMMSDLICLVSTVGSRNRTVEAAAMNLSCKAAALMNLFFIEASDDTGHQLLQEKRIEIEGLLADVLVALMQFAEQASIDISTALVRKIEKNEKKYPIEKSKGKSTKYTDL